MRIDIQRLVDKKMPPAHFLINCLEADPYKKCVRQNPVHAERTPSSTNPQPGKEMEDIPTQLWHIPVTLNLRRMRKIYLTKTKLHFKNDEDSGANA